MFKPLKFITNFVNKFIHGIQTIHHPIIHSIYKTTQELFFDANERFNSFRTSIIPIVKDYEAKFGQNYDIFFSSTGDGLITEYEGAYYAIVAGLRDKYLVNTSNDPDFVYDYESYNKAMMALHDFDLDVDSAENKKKFKSYLNHLNKYIQEAETLYGAGTPAFNQAVNEFKYKNNPQLVIESIKNGTYKGDQSIKYVHKTPKSQYVSQTYQDIKNDPVKWAFYEMFSNQLRNIRRDLPFIWDNIGGEELPWDYIPELSKSFKDNLLSGSLKEMRKSFENGIINSITDHIPISNVGGDKNLFTGKDKQLIPVYMLSGQMEAKDRNRNLADVILAFTAMAEYHKAQSLLKPIMEVLEANVTELATTTDEAKKKNKSLLERLEYFNQVILYARKKDREGVIKGKKFLNERDKTKILQIDREIQKLTDYLAKQTDPKFKDSFRYNDTLKKIERLKEMKETIGRHVTISSIVDSFITYARVLSLGFNGFSAMKDIMQNSINGLIHFSTSPRLFTNHLQNLLNAFKDAFNLTPNKKYDRIANLLGINNFVVESAYGNPNGFKRAGLSHTLKNKIQPFMFLAMSDRAGKLSLGLTLMQNTTAVDENNNPVLVNGAPITFYEAIDSDGNILPGVDFKKFYSKFKQKCAYLYGEYDALSPILAQKGVLGRALITFRRWISSGILNRFGSLEYNYISEEYTKGRYTSLFVNDADPRWQKAPVQFFHAIANLIIGHETLAAQRGNKKVLSEIDADNISKLRGELCIYTFLIANYALLSMIALGINPPEEPEKDVTPEGVKYSKDKSPFTVANLFTAMPLNLLKESIADMEYYFKTATYSGFYKDLVPIIRTAENIYKFMNETVKIATTDPEDRKEYKKLIETKGPNAGNYKVWKYLEKIIPGLYLHQNMQSKLTYPKDLRERTAEDDPSVTKK